MKLWKKLRKIAAPKENWLDQSYTFDEKSSGIYSPVLVGIAHKNPKNPVAESYLKDIQKAQQKGTQAFNSGDFSKAYRYFTIGYLLSQVASHVAYYRNARKLKTKLASEKILELFKLNDNNILYYMELLFKLREEARKFMLKHNMVDEIKKVDADYNLTITFPEKPFLEIEANKETAQSVKKEKAPKESETIKELKSDIKKYIQVLENKNLKPEIRGVIEQELKGAMEELKKLNAEIEDTATADDVTKEIERSKLFVLNKIKEIQNEKNPETKKRMIDKLTELMKLIKSTSEVIAEKEKVIKEVK